MTAKKPISKLSTAKGAPESDVEVTRAFALTLMDLVETMGPRIVVSGCITAATHLLVGRPLRDDDVEIQAAIDAFITTLFSHRDVLREDATMMAPMPAKVM